MKRVLAVIIGLLALCVGSSTAFAVYGDGGPPTIATSTSAPAPGGTFTITIGGFHPNSSVTFTISPEGGGPSVTYTAVSDAQGNVTIVASSPPIAGKYTVTATDEQGTTASLSITVASSPPTGITLPDTGGTVAPAAGGVTPGGPASPSLTLPYTGSTGTMPMLRIGGVAVLVGLGLAGGAKLRRRSRLNAAG